MEELMLSTPLNAHDPPLSQKACFRIGELAREGWMERARRRDCLPLDGSAEPAHCFFDFG